MVLGKMTSTLFDQTEALVEIRHGLSEILKQVESTTDATCIAFAVKEIDIVRMTLLYEYELLDTGNIILEAYLPSYFARRVEILRMTLKQARGHQRELNELWQNTEHRKAQQTIKKGADTVVSAIELLERIIDNLEQGVVRAKHGEMIH